MVLVMMVMMIFVLRGVMVGMVVIVEATVMLWSREYVKILATYEESGENEGERAYIVAHMCKCICGM